MRGALGWTAGTLAAGVLLAPLFFVILRLAVFNTVPHDDYVPFLLWLAGQPGGVFPASPYCYRILSMVAALPLLHWLPDMPLTNLPPGLTSGGLARPALRASVALAALSWLAMTAGAVLAHGLATRLADRAAGLVAAALFVLCCWSTQITAIDTPALLAVLAGVALAGRALPFAALMLAAAATNEKIALVLATWLSLRCLLSARDRAWLWPCWAAAVAAVALHAGAVALLHYPGNEYQLRPGGFAATLRDNLQAYATPRGLLLNVLPTVTLAGLAALAHRRPQSRLFRRADLLVIPAMLALAAVLTQFFQAGRIVMHAAPIFLVPAAIAISAWTRRHAVSPAARRPGRAAPAAAPPRTMD